MNLLFVATLATSMMGGPVPGPGPETVLRAYIETVDPNHPRPRAVAEALVKASDEFNLDWRLVGALAHTESTFNASATSRKGAKGLLQVVPRTWLGKLKEAGIVQREQGLYDPRKGARAGCYVLATYREDSGSLDEALQRYLGTSSPSYLRKIRNRKAAIQRIRDRLDSGE